MSKQLKPCPFCGPTKNGLGIEEEASFVFCKRCYCWGPFAKSKEDAITDWNKRAAPTKGQEEQDAKINK